MGAKSLAAAAPRSRCLMRDSALAHWRTVYKRLTLYDSGRVLYPYIRITPMYAVAWMNKVQTGGTRLGSK